VFETPELRASILARTSLDRRYLDPIIKKYNMMTPKETQDLLGFDRFPENISRKSNSGWESFPFINNEDIREITFQISFIEVAMPRISRYETLYDSVSEIIKRNLPSYKEPSSLIEKGKLIEQFCTYMKTKREAEMQSRRSMQRPLVLTSSERNLEYLVCTIAPRKYKSSANVMLDAMKTVVKPLLAERSDILFRQNFNSTKKYDVQLGIQKRIQKMSMVDLFDLLERNYIESILIYYLAIVENRRFYIDEQYDVFRREYRDYVSPSSQMEQLMEPYNSIIAIMFEQRGIIQKWFSDVIRDGDGGVDFAIPEGLVEDVQAIFDIAGLAMSKDDFDNFWEEMIDSALKEIFPDAFNEEEQVIFFQSSNKPIVTMAKLIPYFREVYGTRNDQSFRYFLKVPTEEDIRQVIQKLQSETEQRLYLSAFSRAQ
jgi:hypothetical protein